MQKVADARYQRSNPPRSRGTHSQGRDIQVQKQIQRKSEQPAQPISHPTTWHDGPDPRTKKKIPFRLNH